MSLTFSQWLETVTTDPIAGILDKLYYAMDRSLSIGHGILITNPEIDTLERFLGDIQSSVTSDLQSPEVREAYKQFKTWEQQTKPVSLVQSVKNAGNVTQPIIKGKEIGVPERLFDLLKIMRAWNQLRKYLVAIKNKAFGAVPVETFYAMLLAANDYLNAGQYFHPLRKVSLARQYSPLER